MRTINREKFEEVDEEVDKEWRKCSRKFCKFVKEITITRVNGNGWENKKGRKTETKELKKIP
jgi:hypothetical protein